MRLGKKRKRRLKHKLRLNANEWLEKPRESAGKAVLLAGHQVVNHPRLKHQQTIKGRKTVVKWWQFGNEWCLVPEVYSIESKTRCVGITRSPRFTIAVRIGTHQ